MNETETRAPALTDDSRRVAMISIPAPNQGIIRRWAAAAGYATTAYETGTRALLELDDDTALVILSDSPKDMTGLACCTAIRRSIPVPILFLTANEDERACTEALAAGADRVVKRSDQESQVIINACELLRQKKKVSGAARCRDAGITLDLDRFSAHSATRELPLTRAQFDLLSCLIAARGRVVNFAEIAKVLRVELRDGCTGRVRVHIHNLRSVLGEESRRLKTIRSRGYIWE